MLAGHKGVGSAELVVAMAVGVEAVVAVIAAALVKTVEDDSYTLNAVVVAAYEMAAEKTKKRH